MNDTQKALRLSQPPRFYSTDGIRRDASQNFNSHWFDAASMRFFDSRIGGATYPTANPAITLFVSSERCDWGGNHPRLYSIRSYDSTTGSIDTIGEFQEYASHGSAHRAAAKMAQRSHDEAKAELAATLDWSHVEG